MPDVYAGLDDKDKFHGKTRLEMFRVCVYKSQISSWHAHMLQSFTLPKTPIWYLVLEWIPVIEGNHPRKWTTHAYGKISEQHADDICSLAQPMLTSSDTNWQISKSPSIPGIPFVLIQTVDFNACCDICRQYKVDV